MDPKHFHFEKISLTADDGISMMEENSPDCYSIIITLEAFYNPAIFSLMSVQADCMAKCLFLAYAHDVAMAQNNTLEFNETFLSI